MDQAECNNNAWLMHSSVLSSEDKVFNNVVKSKK